MRYFIRIPRMRFSEEGYASRANIAPLSLPLQRNRRHVCRGQFALAGQFVVQVASPGPIFHCLWTHACRFVGAFESDSELKELSTAHLDEST
ncbi:MAG: hypothetical protein AUH88_07020 [Acidobacteria bacterium 13_1_40CM_4_61_5]|nr:MAG: hypothetical protein AUH88_07020 [Acidobacteria bacterium 13_1_40CM_4_61_5]